MAENLGGKKYPTRSLVVSTKCAINVHNFDILESQHALEPVKSLTKTLLEDFDSKHYHPSVGNVGKVSFTQRLETKHAIMIQGFFLIFCENCLLLCSYEKPICMANAKK